MDKITKTAVANEDPIAETEITSENILNNVDEADDVMADETTDETVITTENNVDHSETTENRDGE